MSIIAPPIALEIERDVLSVIANNPELMVSVEQILNSDCFYNPENRILFDVMFEIHFEGKLVSASNILQRLFGSGNKDLMTHYQDIKKIYTSSDTLWRNSVTLSDYSTKRKMLTNALELLNLIERDKSIEELDKVATRGLEIATARNRNVDGVKFSESLDKMFELMNRPLINGLSGITTGLKSLNKLTSGFQPTDRILVAGRPGMGKSILAAFHAYEAAKSGDPVALISLEMEDSQLTGRVVSNVSGMSSSDILKGRLVFNQKEHVNNVSKTLRDLPIHYYPNTESADINDICLAMRNWKRRFGIKMVILDFVQLCKDRTVRSQDATSVLDSVVAKLTDLSNQLGIALMILSQLNRNNESLADKRPTPANLKNSGKLEEFGTLIIFPYRQDYYSERQANESGETYIPTNDIEYIIAKNRSDPTGTLLFKCDPALNRITEFPTNDNSVTPQKLMPDAFIKNEVLNNIQTSFM